MSIAEHFVTKIVMLVPKKDFFFLNKEMNKLSRHQPALYFYRFCQTIIFISFLCLDEKREGELIISDSINTICN